MIQNIVKMSLKGWKLILNSHTAEVLLWAYSGYAIRRGVESVEEMNKARKGRIAKEKELEKLKAELAKKEQEAKAEKEKLDKQKQKEDEEYLEKVKREMEEAKKNDPMKKEIDRLLRSADRLLNED